MYKENEDKCLNTPFHFFFVCFFPYFSHTIYYYIVVAVVIALFSVCFCSTTRMRRIIETIFNIFLFTLVGVNWGNWSMIVVTNSFKVRRLLSFHQNSLNLLNSLLQIQSFFVYCLLMTTVYIYCE